NEVDDDCDSDVDEDALDALTWYLDSDGDGYGEDSYAITACDEPSGYVDVGGDCDDANSGINPGVTENDWTVWDDDCDGYAHNDGDSYSLSDGSGTVEFTGENLVADSDSDMDSWSSSSTNWSVDYSRSGNTVSSWTTTSMTWSYVGNADSITLPNSSYTWRNERFGLDITGLTSGYDYAVSLAIMNAASTSDVVYVFTEAQYLAGDETDNIEGMVMNSGDEEFVVGAFTASSSSDRIVICYSGEGLNLTHVYVGEAIVMP
ncbi:hypothetical protein KJ766_02075, partial [Patescibacteria group bacterium]|nr:hypothetical protein [Patescibacteria group bacterium]